ncbi:hypothetical protein MTO98_04305 [Mucilaginibacter sp. SMC90]|uniref:hypothetical protein n=1 Tax=Mucilaginibacter sp. SMC90 TaxID=2929803 RepID=UPI001FB2EDB6|nr:hypothetical protein [Mucilaginibacter sp. SMC90]UOE50294.1 hypothetical protein MTO98_04305 [Mucilaginibacter sp. SMC90]
MNKHLLLTITVLIAIITGSVTATFAQDSAKRKVATLKPNAIPPIVKSSPAALKNPAVTVPARPAYAQPRATAADSALQKDKSLNGQYQYLLSKLYHYQQPLVSALWKNMKDTLNTERRQLKEAKAQLAEQGKNVESLKTEANSKEQALNESNAKRDEISLLGIPFTKATYNLVMWGLVIVFGVVAVIVIARSGAHSREAKYRIKLYEELDEEYKAFKAKANEKEKKLARELQTERNKLDELLGRG